MWWFGQPWFDNEHFDSPWWHALLDEEQGGSYITLGYGQSASLVTTLGLTPAAAVDFVGSYITFGQGQAADVFLRLGLYHGGEGSPVGSPDDGSPTGSPTEPEQPYVIQGAPRLVIPVDPLRAQQFAEDELILLLLMEAAASGALN